MSSSSDWLSESEAIALADNPDTSSLAKMASQLRDSHHGDLITYSRKVFVPLTPGINDLKHVKTRLSQTFSDRLKVVSCNVLVGDQRYAHTQIERPTRRTDRSKHAVSHSYIVLCPFSPYVYALQSNAPITLRVDPLSLRGSTSHSTAS